MTAVAAMTSLITFAEGRRGQFIVGAPGSLLDGDHLAENLIRGTACEDVIISSLILRNWKYGIYLDSDNNSPFDPLINPTLENLTLINDAPTGKVVEYPIRITARANGKRVRGGEIRRCTITSVPGGHQTSPANPYTADQIALQGVEDFLVADCRSHGGGENGMAISRCSQRVSVVRCQGVRADLNGIQVGSALATIWVGDITGWAVGQTLTGATSGRTGVIEAIVDHDGDGRQPARFEVRIDVTGSGTYAGLFDDEESVSNGTTAKTIATLEYTDDVTIEGCYFVDNGADVHSSGAARAGVFATRARAL